MAAEASSQELVQVVTLLAAAVVTVPIFRKFGLGSVLGYLFAGLVIGPWGLKLFTNPNAILHVAELGVVMFLFVIGLEMRPSHLWRMRRDIFGLGTLQIVVCTALLTFIGVALGLSPMVSFLGGMGFVLTSTAVVMQLLRERGDLGLAKGQKMVSILLFEDLLIVPLLALISLLAPKVVAEQSSYWISVGAGLVAVASLIVAGIWLLNPLFRLLALAGARELLTAAALLVVLGSALLMQLSGLSMAMGAFLAGVLLAESSFRHQIEADIEPFRGILLGLFFIGVGMSLDLGTVLQSWPAILSLVLLLMTGKAASIYLVARLTKADHRTSLERAVIMAQGGEFAFVLYAASTQAGLISAEVNARFTAVVVLSMALTPLIVILAKPLMKKEDASMEDVESPHELGSCALIIGFGRFGQVVSQLLLARNMDVTIIDSDPDRIRNARKFGFKIYYGDGSRLDVLRASGAEKVCVVAVCVENKQVATEILKLVKHEFPHAKVLVRAYDRIHAREVTLAGVDYQIRETFESALVFAQQTLREMEVPEEEILAIAQDIRRRDKERFQIEVATGDSEAGRKFLHSNLPTPAPLVEPKRDPVALNPEAGLVESK